MKYKIPNHEDFIKRILTEELPTHKPCMVCGKDETLCIITDLQAKPLWLCSTHAGQWLSKHPSK